MTSKQLEETLKRVFETQPNFRDAYTNYDYNIAEAIMLLQRRLDEQVKNVSDSLDKVAEGLFAIANAIKEKK